MFASFDTGCGILRCLSTRAMKFISVVFSLFSYFPSRPGVENGHPLAARPLANPSSDISLGPRLHFPAAQRVFTSLILEPGDLASRGSLSLRTVHFFFLTLAGLS